MDWGVVEVVRYNHQEIELLCPDLLNGSYFVEIKKWSYISDKFSIYKSDLLDGNTYLALETNIVFYSDMKCTAVHPFKWVKLLVSEWRKQREQVFPTRQTYKVGDYVSRAFESGYGCPESRVKYKAQKPLDISQYAFTWSSYFSGDILWKKWELSLVSMWVNPVEIELPLEESCLVECSLKHTDWMNFSFAPIDDFQFFAEWDTVFFV